MIQSFSEEHILAKSLLSHALLIYLSHSTMLDKKAQFPYAIQQFAVEQEDSIPIKNFGSPATIKNMSKFNC